MLSLPPTVRLILCTDPTDMREGFNSLAQLVENQDLALAAALQPQAGRLQAVGSDQRSWWRSNGPNPPPVGHPVV